MCAALKQASSRLRWMELIDAVASPSRESDLSDGGGPSGRGLWRDPSFEPEPARGARYQLPLNQRDVVVHQHIPPASRGTRNGGRWTLRHREQSFWDFWVNAGERLRRAGW